MIEFHEQQLEAAVNEWRAARYAVTAAEQKCMRLLFAVFAEKVEPPKCLGITDEELQQLREGVR